MLYILITKQSVFLANFTVAQIQIKNTKNKKTTTGSGPSGVLFIQQKQYPKFHNWVIFNNLIKYLNENNKCF